VESQKGDYCTINFGLQSLSAGTPKSHVAATKSCAQALNHVVNDFLTGLPTVLDKLPY